MIQFFSDIQDLKVTEKLLYKIIHQYGPITKNEAYNHVGSSLSTVSRVIDNLAKKQLIQVDNKDIAGGRNPSKYIITPDACYSFGAYICHEIYGIGLCDIAGNILEKTEALLDKTTTPADVANFFAHFIRAVLPKYQLEKDEMPGIGVAVAGPILKSKGMIYHPYHFAVPGWDLVPIKDIIEMKTGYPVWIDSLTETVLLSELAYGPHKGCSSAVYLWINKGVGSAFYSNGMFGIKNEDINTSLGHTVIDFKGKRPCICGRRGCLETYLSVNAMLSGIHAIKPEIEVQVANVNSSKEQIWTFNPELSPLEQNQYSQEPALRAFFQEISEAFTVATLNFLHITRPEVLFWGGRTTIQLPAVFECAFENIQKAYSQYFEKELQCIQSHITDQLLITGAGFLVFDNYLQYFGQQSAT